MHLNGLFLYVSILVCSVARHPEPHGLVRGESVLGAPSLLSLLLYARREGIVEVRERRPDAHCVGGAPSRRNGWLAGLPCAARVEVYPI